MDRDNTWSADEAHRNAGASVANCGSKLRHQAAQAAQRGRAARVEELPRLLALRPIAPAAGAATAPAAGSATPRRPAQERARPRWRACQTQRRGISMDVARSGGTGEGDASRDGEDCATRSAATRGGRRGSAASAAAGQHLGGRRAGSSQGAQMQPAGDTQEACRGERGPLRTLCRHDPGDVLPERRKPGARRWTTCPPSEARRAVASAPRVTWQPGRNAGRAAPSVQLGARRRTRRGALFGTWLVRCAVRCGARSA